MSKKEIKTLKESLIEIVDFFNEKISFKFFGAAALPVINFIINGLFVKMEPNIYNGLLFLIILAFFMAILYKILKPKRKEKYRTSAMMIYFMAIFFSAVTYTNSNISVFFPSFFTAYVINLVNNLEEFKF